MKKHVIWYNLLFLELDKIGWDTQCNSVDQTSWDTPEENLDQIKRDTPVQDLDQIRLDSLVDDLDHIGLETLVELLKKDIQSEDANSEDANSEDTDTEDTDTEDADTEDADTEDADIKDADTKDVANKYNASLDTDLLFRYFNDLKCTGPRLDREQEFWLALDVQAGLRMSQAISSDGIAEVYGDLRDNWAQFSAMIESLRLPSIDWDRAVSVIAQQRLNKECVRFSEIFPWLESMKDHPEVRQKISHHATRIYLDLVILPVAILLMIAGHFAKDDLELPDGNETDHWFTADPMIEWPIYEIFTQADQAKKQLISSNLRLVVYIAKRFRGRGVEFADLIQQGNLGLFRAIYKYDPSRGSKFSTYADSWIRKEIRSYIADNSSIFYFSGNKSEKRRLVYKARERLCQQMQRLPTAKEIAETLGSITASEIANLLEFDIVTISCDEPADESDDDVLEDIIEELAPIDLVHVVDQHYLEKDIQIILSMLPDIQREVITLHFGFDGQERTLKEVGDILGFPEQRIHKIEAAALKYLRYPARSNLLREYLDLLLLLS